MNFIKKSLFLSLIIAFSVFQAKAEKIKVVSYSNVGEIDVTPDEKVSSIDLAIVKTIHVPESRRLIYDQFVKIECDEMERGYQPYKITSNTIHLNDNNKTLKEFGIEKIGKGDSIFIVCKAPVEVKS